MGKSNIEWTDFTFNPWRGCTKATWEGADGKTHLHPGCLNCYAEVDMSVKLHGIRWGKGQERVPKADSGWKEPIRWVRAAAKVGERRKVFCASLADVLDSEVPNAMRHRLWDVIGRTYHRCSQCSVDGGVCPTRTLPVNHFDGAGLDWLLLTKRPENWALVPDHIRPLVWLGTSISDQRTADEWVPRLLEAQGFRCRFLSVEPMVGPVDVSRWLTGRKWYVAKCRDCGYLASTGTFIGRPTGQGDADVGCPKCASVRNDVVSDTGVDWVIVGGESGHKARPCHVEWIRSIVRQCGEAGVACFVKQLGADPRETYGRLSDAPMPLKDPKGGGWDEWPEDLRVREFPNVHA